MAIIKRQHLQEMEELSQQLSNLVQSQMQLQIDNLWQQVLGEIN